MSKQMYSVFSGRAAGRFLASIVLLSTVPLLGACSSGMERFNYPSFGLADGDTTASLPVPKEPMFGSPRTSAPTPPPDYSNRPVTLNNQRRSNAGGYGNNQPYGTSQGYGSQNGSNSYGNSQRSGGNSPYGNNTTSNNSYRNNANGSSQNTGPFNNGSRNNGSYNNGSGRSGYGQQNSVRVARLPEQNASRGPLPIRGTIPQVTYNQPEAARSSAARPATAKPAARSQNNASGQVIEVVQGQSLYGIARAYGVRVQDIKTVNNLQSNSVKVGQKLIIPGQGTARRTNQRTAYAAPAKRPAQNNVRSVRTQPLVRNPNTGRVYRVARGDSLYGIARRHGMTVGELARFNGISQSTALRPGQDLSIPRGVKSATSARRQPAKVAPAQVARRTQRPAASPRLPSPGSRQARKFRWPVEGRIISRFGSKNNGTHNDGVNLAVPSGTSVRSAENGVVAYSGNELKGYGNLILIRHADNWVSAYAHVDKILVSRGDKISRGQVIAKSGKTGGVDRPQVHFELRKNSKPVNPLTHLASR